MGPFSFVYPQPDVLVVLHVPTETACAIVNTDGKLDLKRVHDALATLNANIGLKASDG